MNHKAFLAAGLDAGTTYTRCVICTLEEGRFRFLGCGMDSAAGWVKSRIADQTAISESVLRAVQQAEEMSGRQIESVTAGFGGLTVRGAHARSRLELGRPREIEQRDVNRALE